MKHVNIPVFIPHLGCPNGCVFCNQRTISGKHAFDLSAVPGEIETALSAVEAGTTVPTEVEIAFFGGSFTGINRDDMIFLLETAQRYIDDGRVSSIRLSTRPDYIDDGILSILGHYGVRDIELGIQSLDDAVLTASQRGHTAACALRACYAVKRAGFRLIGQMMLGLPGSTPEAETATARGICEAGADGARIYPTTVLQDTELDAMTRAGEYLPLSLPEAIERAVSVYEIFLAHDVPVIRCGLCASEELLGETGITAGSYHSAFGELTASALYLRRIRAALDRCPPPPGASLTIYCPKRSASQVAGQKRENKMIIQNEYNVKNVKIIEKDNLLRYNIEIEYRPFPSRGDDE